MTVFTSVGLFVGLIKYNHHQVIHFECFGELAGARTQDPRLKRALLYLLSYELSPTTT